MAYIASPEAPPEARSTCPRLVREMDVISLGSSMDVPCVQELAKGPLTTIPEKYVCSDQEPPSMVDAILLTDIPVINLQNLLAGDLKSPELQKLHYACLRLLREMEPKSASLGSSIHVPCVQELAKGPLATIPHRYVRSNQEPSIKDNHTLSPNIPVINLQNLLTGDSKNIELQKLHGACKEWGFFQLTNHGVSSTLMNKVKLEIKNLFDLPMEEKKKLWQERGDLQGFGQLFVVSEEQKLDWADLFYMMVLPTQMRKPDLFSRLPSSFRDTMVSYSAEVKNIVIKLLDQMARALNITRPEELRELYEGGLQAMRINYYPPCPQPDLVMGLTPHSDAGGLTILLQINEVEGLQIKKDGMWVPVKPLSNAFVVNIGDSLEITTNGIYKSIEHRAVVNSEQERLSIATFHSPNMDGVLSPTPSLITTETPTLFKEIGVADYYRRFLGSKLHEKSNLDYLRIQPKEQGDS